MKRSRWVRNKTNKHDRKKKKRMEKKKIFVVVCVCYPKRFLIFLFKLFYVLNLIFLFSFYFTS